jgi:hypothetical protein
MAIPCWSRNVTPEKIRDKYQGALMKENQMDRRDRFPRAKASKKLASSVRLKSSYQEILKSELWGSLSKLEHRAEILTAISHDQRISGRYELAEAYKKQSIHSKAKAQSIRKLLDLA